MRAGDQEAIRSLVLDGMRERWGEAYDAAANSDMDDIAHTYVDAGAQVVVAEVDGLVVGCGILLSESGRRGRIVRVSVHKDHRRKGVGREVVNSLVHSARRRRMTEVVVTTDVPWTSAVALYLACGFVEVGRDKHDVHFVKLLTRRSG